MAEYSNVQDDEEGVVSGRWSFGGAQRLQRAVDREAELTAPRYSIEALKAIGPVGHRHINFRGTYRFPIGRYSERLVPTAA